MTRLLDRYVLGIFIPALVLFTLTLLFLFIAVDCAAKLGKFLELKVPEGVLRFVIYYYLVRIPMLLTILIPSVMIFAPTFTVIKLARSNEILPIATSGISLRRLSLPFLVTAVLAAFSLAAMDEFVLPRIGGEIARTDALVSQRGFSFAVEDYDGRTKISAQHFDIPTLLLSGEVRITRLDETMQPVEIITAKRCQWDPTRKRWVAFEGFIEKPQELQHVPGEKPRTWKQPIPAEGTVVESKLNPDTIRKDVAVTGRFSFETLENMRRNMRRYPHVPSFTIQFHARFSFPLSPIVLLLVGLPFVMDPQSKSFIKGLIFCFLLALGFYLIHFACMDLGNKGSIRPLLAAWLPITTFGAVGLWTFSRMRT